MLACTAVQLAGQGLDAAAVLEALDAQIATAHSYLCLLYTSRCV